MDGNLELSVILLWKSTGWAAVRLHLLCTAQVCPAEGAKRGDGVGRRIQKVGGLNCIHCLNSTHTVSFLESESV